MLTKIALVLAFACLLFFQAWDAAKVIPFVLGNHVVAQEHSMP